MKALTEISRSGTSIWLDDLSRERLQRGGRSTLLADLIKNNHVVGVTTNPAIFSSAISGSDLYASEIAELASAGLTAEEIVTELTTSDVRRACDLFAPIFEATRGVDGRVSIEVDPRLARDTTGTIEQARLLWKLVNRPNVLIKVPATKEGLPAISALIAEGISVNVTIIFSVERYRQVLDSYLQGLEARIRQGNPISGIHSVASFFISRVDSEIDPQLRAIGNSSLCGKAAIANARLAYEHFEEISRSNRWQALEGEGGFLQRPLWASTGVKDPSYDPTMYVTELVAPQTVNTMPESTLIAVRDSDNFKGNAIAGTYENSARIIETLRREKIDIDQVAAKLENEGIDKFIKPWLDLLAVVSKASSR